MCNSLPNYKEYPWLDVRYAQNCKAFNQWRGIYRVINGKKHSLEMRLQHNANWGTLEFVMYLDGRYMCIGNYQIYGESLLAIARKAKKLIKENQEFDRMCQEE